MRRPRNNGRRTPRSNAASHSSNSETRRAGPSDYTHSCTSLHYRIRAARRVSGSDGERVGHVPSYNGTRACPHRHARLHALSSLAAPMACQLFDRYVKTPVYPAFHPTSPRRWSLGRRHSRSNSAQSGIQKGRSRATRTIRQPRRRRLLHCGPLGLS